MKEIRNVQLTEFQKEIINKLDDKYCYKISRGAGIYSGGYNAIKIFNKKMEHLFTIDERDNTVSINNYIKNRKKELEFLELILKENK
ncbi:hypothetical protein GL982_10445 (plasmid) [Spiroplasma citri]|uniref:hypothetical protein n=1 Tax=Spiroplasma citri TaxID=2133 RepID=UPI0013A07E86|nr:hypothetical protein [Spiroplasma citri]QIA73206.1 hypothetical protein GL982_06040 [Spiroplasma citri]QIA73382.1 hypothetical protein GL982_07085 [Spiroplasma citri]QIA73962.1 hypothetical protein GL982_10445 [Spiroplasma citri]